MIQPSGSRPDSPESRSFGGFGFLPAPHGSAAVLPGGSSRSGFRIHEVSRDGDRSPWRGRRFAFAAASAVSLAAIALGGALPTGAGPSSAARATGAGNTVTPLDTPSRGESGSPAGRRGAGHGTLATRGSGERSIAAVPATAPSVAPAAPSATPVVLSTASLAGNPYATHVLTNVSAPPLIRPTGTTPLFAQVFGRLAAQSPAPSAPPSGTQSSPPPWAQSSASALPTPADLGLPLSSRR